jgi:hypothetical protein
MLPGKVPGQWSQQHPWQMPLVVSPAHRARRLLHMLRKEHSTPVAQPAAGCRGSDYPCVVAVLTLSVENCGGGLWQQRVG